MFQLFQKTKTNSHFIPISSRKSLPLTSPFEEIWSISVGQNAAFFAADVDGDGLTEIALREGTAIKLLDENGSLESVRDLEIPFPIS